MYGLLDYGKMMADGPRRIAYEEALRQVVTPGCRVLDVGCGLGIFTLMACRLGAARVDAVEPNPCIEVARQIIRDNGYQDRVHFFPGRSRDFQPPEEAGGALADVLVADLRSVLPMAGHHLPSLDDARRRLLRAGGVMIPRRDSLWLAVVEDAVLYARQVRPWQDGAAGFDFSAAEQLTRHGWCKARLAPERLLTTAARWAVIDYADCGVPDVRGGVESEVQRTATAHGMVVWFDTELIAGVSLSNAPDRPELIYGSAFFPFLNPLEVRQGDRLHLHIDATLVGEEYVWTWTTEHRRGDDELSSFRQSTFFSQILTPRRLASRGP